MSAEEIMTNGQCGCFDDIGSAICAYIIPCILFGQTNTAAGIGNGCFVDALLYLIVPLRLYHACMRGNLQTKLGVQDKGIVGNLCCDSLICGCCSLAQEARAVAAFNGGAN